MNREARETTSNKKSRALGFSICSDSIVPGILKACPSHSLLNNPVCMRSFISLSLWMRALRFREVESDLHKITSQANSLSPLFLFPSPPEESSESLRD